MTTPGPSPHPSSARLPARPAAPSPDLSALSHDLTARYALGEALGKGGFGTVHRATELAAGREVALKLLNAGRDAVALERFLREAAVAATLEHPGVVRVHAAGTHQGRPAIVYELIDGETFGHASRGLAPRRRAELVRDAARAVGFAHARGVVHRDLKPDNLLVGRDGRVRVADFGLALFEGADRLTRTGALVGSPSYMAPELFTRGREAAGPAADVWALGVILYEALTGRLPFDADNLVRLAALLESAHVTPPSELDPQVDGAVEAVCLRALAADPARRFPDAEALAAALDEALAGRLALPERGRRAALLAAPVGLVLLAGLGVALAARGGGAPSAPAPPPAPPPEPTVAPPPVAQPAGEPAATPATRQAQDEPPIDTRLFMADDPHWAVALDERRVLTGGARDEVRLWEAGPGREVRAWRLRETRAAALAASGRVYVCANDGVYALDPADVRAPALALDVSRTRSLCAAARAERVVAMETDRRDERLHRLHVLQPGRPATSFDAPPLAEGPLALSFDGATLAVSTSDASGGPVHLIDLSGPAPVTRHQVTLPGWARCLAFGPDGRLYLASSMGQVLAVDVARGAVLLDEGYEDGDVHVGAHRGKIRALAVARDGTRLVSCAETGRGWELKAWDRLSRTRLGPPVEGRGQVRGVSLSPGGRLLALATQDAGVHALSVRR